MPIFSACALASSHTLSTGTVRLPAIVGLGRALDLTLTGRAVSAAEALSMGLVTQVVPRGQALPAALQLAQQLAALPQQCMRNDRLSVYSSVYDGREGLQRRLASEFEFGLRSMAAAEFVTGPRAFARGAGRHGASASEQPQQQPLQQQQSRL